MRALSTFAKLTAADRALALEALLLLLLAWLLIVAVPMRRWRRHVDIAHGPQPGRVREGDGKAPAARGSSRPMLEPRRAGRIVRKVSAALPFDPRCLARAMAVQWMLRRRGLASQLVFGAGRFGARPALRYHAWLHVDGRPVIGGGPATNFAPFPVHADPDPPPV